MSYSSRRLPVGDCPSHVIPFYGAQVGWDTSREHYLTLNCSVCGHQLGRDDDGFSVVLVDGAIDDTPDGLVAVCEGCSYSNDDDRLVPERREAEAKARFSIQATPTTLAQRKAAQLRRAASAGG